MRAWVDIERTVPQTFSAYCRICDARRQREKKGYRPREWYAHGRPGSPEYRAHTNAMDRASAARRRRDPAYRANQNEYWRIWNNAHTGAIARRTISDSYTFVDPTPFLKWCDQNPHLTLTDTQIRAIARLRQGEHDLARLSTIDEIMTANHSHYLVSILYPHKNESEAA